MAARDKVTFSLALKKDKNVFEIKRKWGLNYVPFRTARKCSCTEPFWVFLEMSLPFMGGKVVACATHIPSG